MFLRHHCGWQSTADLPTTVSYLQSIYIYSMFALQSPTLLKTTGWHVSLKINNVSKALWRELLLLSVIPAISLRRHGALPPSVRRIDVFTHRGFHVR